ncbi:MAG: HEPN domain-containing protein [Chitinispirillales bacterium]|jgi:HEPN domain-containing protein|nr:HEPN domain-containing protein [Chitinispirillales bacterium]
MTLDEKVQYWIDLSNNDLSVAEILIKNGQNLYAGFMCHQAIEKIFKGYYAKVIKDTPPYIHNLTTLSEKSNLSDLLTDEQKVFLAVLNPLNMEVRYPNYKKGIAQTLTNEKTQEILAQTKELLQWTIKKILS